MLIRSVAHSLIPHEVLRPVLSFASRFLSSRFSNTLTLVVEENGFIRDELYDAAEIYLRTKIGPAVGRLRIRKTHKQKEFTLSLLNDEEIVDRYDGFDVRWKYICVRSSNCPTREEKSFQLTFPKKLKERVIGSYLPYVLARGEEIREEKRAVRIYSTDCPDKQGAYWGSVILQHPASFDTLALDSDLKRMIIGDLEKFVERKEFYKKVGRAWKRGYLLYGPPGTGKSTLIAAMANYLKFDIYDLELSSVYSNSDLKRVLLSTSNRSILVIEDIDCSSSKVHVRQDDGGDDDGGGQELEPRLTLSGILNFIDGLWSSCGDERIIVFTTNHKERLDPALLRPGRMDVHINLSYCTPEAFAILASNYLNVDDGSHRLYGEIEELIRSVDVTPAEVTEELIKNEDVDLAFEGVIDLLRKRKTGAVVEEEESVQRLNGESSFDNKDVVN
ncbi:unnamed protein product [Linum tenue]|uniref:AAA+ ATPase domain-containing protein n=1 Tax=Linum tenue TaxID=586396 RepID=A0AAV0K8K0_9ROSI|nr:unnamed protein product [Linum tenue]